MKKRKTLEVSIMEIGLKAGLGISVVLIMYFMLLKHFKFIDSEVAWGFNFMILFIGILLTYSYYRTKTQPIIDYISGLILGCIITVASVVPFGLFVYMYFTQINPSLLLLLKSNVLFMGEQITSERVTIATLIEGLSSGFLMSFIIMQYYKAGFSRRLNSTETMG